MIEILIQPSKKADKKFDAIIDGKKTVSFGAKGYSDFTQQSIYGEESKQEDTGIYDGPAWVRHVYYCACSRQYERVFYHVIL